MFRDIENWQRVSCYKIVSADAWISIWDGDTYKDKDSPDVVVDGRTTDTSSVSIALIVNVSMKLPERRSRSIAWQFPKY